MGADGSESTLVVSRPRAVPMEHLSTRELLGEISGTASLLVKREVVLAREELKADLRSEVAMAKGLVGALVTGLLGLNILLVAVVFALALVMPAWLAALLIGGTLFIIAVIVGVVSWQQRVTNPLAVTRKTLTETIQWAKDRVARRSLTC